MQAPSTKAKDGEEPETRSLPATIAPAPRVENARTRDLPHEVYDPELADATVRFPACLKDERFLHVLRSLFAFFLKSLWTFLASKKLSKEELERRSALAVKELLIELGPTYIKLGQFLSVRRDLLPVSMADELSSLQDRVPPFSLELLRKIVSQELGAPPEELFAYFDPIPLASASIGQVHRIQLQDGRQAVLKVQRSGLSHDFYRDLGLMRLAAKSGLRFDAWKNHWRQKLKIEGPKRPARFDFNNWLEMSDEFGKNLFSEVDYLLEGRNADRMRRLMRDKPEVRIPRVIWKYSARKVLTLEYLEGIKIDRVNELKAKGIDLEQVGNLLISTFLEQIVIKGFFHADPHAGNLAVDRNGCLIIFDFGMIGEISEVQRRSLLSCVMATVRKDADLLVRGLVDLGVVRSGTNHEAIARALTPFMDYYAGKSIFDLDFRQLEHDIDIVVTERSLRLPANLAYILRAGSSLEGIARTLKPDFSFIQAVRPLVKRLIAIEGMEALSTFEGLMQLAGLAVNGLKRVSQRDENSAQNNHNYQKQIQAIETSKKPAPCRKCVRQARDMRLLKKQLFSTGFIGAAYFSISTASLIAQNPAILTNYRETGFYMVVGNIILGGIMIWKLLHLSKWNPKSIASAEAEQNGEKKC
ncbi:MAG: AarF/ABC1/UbiB kinase family protein [Candidatus Obscuribacterales bacterium]|nr:AarF/ABC1/UbiB kinase family protein [Candidatus Obscuribacterales bacterium]